ncbi:ATP/GTP-binding protein [Yinghuangia seranimata]|uniref:ATP/GTP-binding protein n=1 Tax=Yinghuangia seranimata TaxID=408067 RepID=UPI00248B43F4|nr:ATP/GTP-binding protein [Yinghuangia seranimata]MDI2127150.1 ATP/GTP-binding protein [Yinghuangia seranimata]
MRSTQLPAGGTGLVSELSFAERYWANGTWPVFVDSPNGPAFPVPFPAEAPVGPQVQGAAVVQPSPAQLAQVAVSRLRLPSPVVGTSPSGDQVVRVPTWLWVDRSVWGPVSATAAVPGVSVTATAVPVSVVWSMGTGESVNCAGPGTPYVPGSDAAAASPDCGYTYTRSSAGQRGERFAVSVTVSWRVTWVGGGQSGTVEGLSTTTAVDLRVREVQAVIVNPSP